MSCALAAAETPCIHHLRQHIFTQISHGRGRAFNARDETGAPLTSGTKYGNDFSTVRSIRSIDRPKLPQRNTLPVAENSLKPYRHRAYQISISSIFISFSFDGDGLDFEVLERAAKRAGNALLIPRSRRRHRRRRDRRGNEQL